MTFHDGTPLTAEIVKGSMDRFLDPENAWTFRFLLDAISNVEVTGPYTLELTLANQFAPLLAHLTHSSTAIILPAAAAQHGDDFASNPVGTGPFKFVSWQRNDAIELERYDGYWGEKPGVSGVRFLTVPENATRMALVESGQAHVAVRVPPQDIARLNAADGVTVENVSSLRTIFMFMNFTHEPINDVRVRQAINYAIDNEALAEFVLGGAVRPSDAPIAPGIFGYTPVGDYDYNPERARELLAEAGYADGFSTSLYTPSGRYLQDIQTVEAMQGMLAEVGITATIETLEWSAYLEKVNAIPGERRVHRPPRLGTVTGDADYGLYRSSTPPSSARGLQPWRLLQRSRRRAPRRRPHQHQPRRAPGRLRRGHDPHLGRRRLALPSQRDPARRRARQRERPGHPPDRARAGSHR